jgi:hypothetical protein
VTDEDVAELRVVTQDVVEREDDAARIAEEDVDALAEEGLAQDVGTDPRALEVTRLVEHVLAGALDRRGVLRSIAGHVAAARSGRRTRRFRGIGPDRHRGPSVRDRQRKTLASRRGSLR